MPRSPNPSPRLAAPLALAAVALALATPGCSSNASRAAPDLPNTESGFLRDYSRLKPSPRHADTRYQQSRALSAYTAFLVDPVVVLPGETVRGEPIDGAQAAALSDALRKELTDALRLRDRLATAPGPGVARIRAAITGVARSNRGSSGEPMIGGASVEAEIVDSVTGVRLAAVVESDIVEDVELGRSADPFYDARLVFRHWASRLNLWLESADELATE